MRPRLHSGLRRLREQGGQTASEYLGVILVIAAIVGVIAQSSIDLTFERGVERNNCRVLSDDDCEDGASTDLEGKGDEEPRAGARDSPGSGGDSPGTDAGGAPGGSPSPAPGATLPPAGGEPSPAGPSLRFADVRDRPAEPVNVSAADSDPEPEGGEVTPPACEEGQDIGNGQKISCHDGVPILDLDDNGVNDYEEAERFRFQEPTDFNDNGVPDAEEPGALKYGLQRLYRPGQPGVYCEKSVGVEGQVDCAPYPELFDKVLERTTVPPGEALIRALDLADKVSTVLAPLKGLVTRLAKEGLERAVRPLVQRIRQGLRKLSKKGDDGRRPPPIRGGAPTADEILKKASEYRGRRFPERAQPNEVLVKHHPDTGATTNYVVYGSDGRPLYRVDVTGRPHNGVPTPHVVEYERHVNPRTGEVFVRRGRGVRAADPEEVPSK